MTNTEFNLRDKRKEYFARECHRRRNEICPLLETNSKGQKERVTWAQLFERKYHQSLDNYILEMGL